LRALILSLILLAQAAVSAVNGLNADNSLNRTKISSAYFEGDFPMVIEALETFRKVNPNPSTEDKIFVYKYLGVIYAYRHETMPKAESCLYQLIKLNPSIELVDLYISDSIEAVFEKVKARYEKQQKVSGSTSETSRPQGNKSRNAAAEEVRTESVISSSNAKKQEPFSESKASKPKSGQSWIWWTAGAAGIGALVVGYYYLSDGPSPKSPAIDTLEL
jgi:hypothetical protein